MLCRNRLLQSLSLLLLVLFGIAAGAQSTTGQWSSLQTWPYRGVHVHLLPNGKVLFFSYYSEGLNPQIWDPATNTVTPAQSVPYSIFCTGHSFLADGRLFVSGGHIADYTGFTHTILYDWRTNTWTAGPEMNAGRWYPTNTTLPNGDVLVISGDINSNTNVDTLPQVYQAGTNNFRNLSSATLALPLYPRMFVAPNGQVFYAGPSSPSRYLDTSGTGSWSSVGNLLHSPRDYGSAVMYDVGKAIYIGGGGSSTGSTPQSTAEIINLNSTTPAWAATGSMHFHRRQHNATVLPDATVLVTGGGSCGGFDPSNCPVYTPEIWNPSTGAFTNMASDPAQIYRGYHSTALLLPDGRVLSAGGNIGGPNASLFSPPYLFKGARPTIDSAPSGTNFGETFFVATPDAASISNVSFIKMGSVTHAGNYDQRYIPLTQTAANGGINITAPANGNIAPPGYYMLFLVNSSGVPSVGAIMQICSSCSSGAVTTGTITGTVTDVATTSPINGATVSAGGVATSTAADGTYTLTNVPAGASVTVTASATGYQSANQSVALLPGGEAMANFALVANSSSGTGTVSGTVTNASNSAAIAGATVSGGGQNTTTAADGTYTLRDVPAGTPVNITASATGFQNSQQTVTLTSDGSSTLNFSLTPVTTGSITGGVFKASDGTAIPGATVSGGGVTTTTDASGTYTLNSVPAGAVSVSASASGFQSSTQSVTVNAGATATASFSLAAASTGTGSVTGTVTNLKTGAAISGAVVSWNGGSTTATTNSSGVYTLSGLPAGAYTFTAKASGYLNHSTTATVNGGAATTLNFQLSTAGKIAGTVTNTSSAAVAGATVNINGGQIVTSLTLTTDATGSYATGYVPIGSYTVAASASGFQPATQTVSVSSGATATANFALAAGSTTTGTISGTVINAGTNAAIAGASVSGGGQTATTDANGAYALSNVAAGTVSVTASASGFQSATLSVPVTAGATTTANFSLSPATSGAGTVTGTVTNIKSGAVLAGATVTYSGGSTTANSSGVYTLSNVAGGTYTFTASASGYLPRSGSASVTGGATTTLSFQLSTAGKIAGAVTNGSGAGVAGATINISGGQIATTVTLTSDSTGHYLSGYIPIGSYTVTASASGHTTQSKSTTVSAGVTSTVNFTSF